MVYLTQLKIEFQKIKHSLYTQKPNGMFELRFSTIYFLRKTLVSILLFQCVYLLKFSMIFPDGEFIRQNQMKCQRLVR